MSKQIIIDWQRDGLFVATGSRRGNNVAIDTLITTGGEEGASGSSTAISTQLYALAKQFDLHKAEATVIAPREILEFRTLSVPRGEVNEIPDMVRFQAQRQMANIGDTWALDYILLPDQPGQEGTSALAATISPAHMAEIEATCSDLGINLTRVLARPVEIARWGVAAGGLGTTEVSMVVTLSQTHADLLLLSSGNLIQLRGTRLPEDPAVTANTLVSEIRRSMMAASSFVNNQPATKILLIAAPDLAERVEAAIAQATGASVAVIDPASVLPASLPERHEIAQRSASRLAAIAGVVSNPSPDKRDVIDLKNCKRREPKKSRKQQNILIGSAAGVLALAGAVWWWSANAALDSAIATALATEKQTKELVETGSKMLKNRQDVDQFLGGSINWLDEMSYVATKLPPADQAMVAGPALTVLRDNSGQITFVLDAKDAQTINRVQQDLTNKNHAVSGSGSQERPSRNGEYSWTAQETIHIAPQPWDPLATQPKPAPASPAAEQAAKPAAADNSAATQRAAAATPPSRGEAEPSAASPSAAIPQAAPAPTESATPATLKTDAPKSDSAEAPPAGPTAAAAAPAAEQAPASSPAPSSTPTGTPAPTTPAPTTTPAPSAAPAPSQTPAAAADAPPPTQ